MGSINIPLYQVGGFTLKEYAPTSLHFSRSRSFRFAIFTYPRGTRAAENYAYNQPKVDEFAKAQEPTSIRFRREIRRDVEERAPDRMRTAGAHWRYKWPSSNLPACKRPIGPPDGIRARCNARSRMTRGDWGPKRTPGRLPSRRSKNIRLLDEPRAPQLATIDLSEVGRLLNCAVSRWGESGT